MSPGATRLKIQIVFLFFSIENMQAVIGSRDVFFGVSKFNSEMQVMFCGRILSNL